MQRNDRKLLREIAAVIAIKLALLSALWWAFIRDQRVQIDVDHMARQTAATASRAHDNPDGETDGHRATR